jgi:hypothetical protein
MEIKNGWRSECLYCARNAVYKLAYLFITLLFGCFIVFLPPSQSYKTAGYWAGVRHWSRLDVYILLPLHFRLCVYCRRMDGMYVLSLKYY